MFFRKDEKVFSLAGTTGVIIRSDIRALWGEFFSYLLVAGLYKEGVYDRDGTDCAENGSISTNYFFLSQSAYAGNLGKTITAGLRDRFMALLGHPDLNEQERSVLSDIDGLFSSDNPSYVRLSAKQIITIAKTRNLSDNMYAIAHYTAIAFGQRDFPEETILPRLSLSFFGNIHLSQTDTVKVGAPELIYRGKAPDDSVANGAQVTALWALMSAQIGSLTEVEYPGEKLVDMLSTFSFMSASSDWSKSVTIPRVASAIYIRSLSGIDHNKAGPVAGLFYQSFLYGQTGQLTVIRQGLFRYILNLMVKKMGVSHQGCLFQTESLYRKLSDTVTIYGREPRRSALLEYALEALDSDLEPAADETDTPPEADSLEPAADEPASPLDDLETDPSAVDGGFDPSLAPPAVPAMEEDTIDLISFDKTGEGVDEDLYRSAVVVLNDRLQNDDSVPVKAEVKDALDYWVNGFLYLTAITATKDQIASLGLQEYLKNVSTKG